MIPANNTVPYRTTPVVTLAIVALCVLAFLYQLTLSETQLRAFLANYALVPRRFTDGTFATGEGLQRFDATPFVTSMFLHGGFLHIAANLWTLWVFGPALEERLGRARFALLYLAAGLAAGLLHLIFNYSSAVPALGASGAIAGVIAAYARRFPYAWVNVLQPIVILPVFFMMPALLFAGLWFATQVVQATGSLAAPASGAGIAWWAHIGGFLAGWFLLPRVAPTGHAVDDVHAATHSALWPLQVWQRWIGWWLRRR